jgi:hypothetical protein
MRNPVEIWKKLKDIYEMRGFRACFYLWQKLFTLRLVDYRQYNSKAIEMHIDECRSYCQQLHSSGATVANEIEASVLLNGLDSGYESFIVETTQSFRQNRYGSDIDVDNLISQLTDEDRRRHARSSNSPIATYKPGTESALAARARLPINYKRPQLECHHCHKPGHTEKDCWQLYPEKRLEAAKQAYAHASQIAGHIEPKPSGSTEVINVRML